MPSWCMSLCMKSPVALNAYTVVCIDLSCAFQDQVCMYAETFPEDCNERDDAQRALGPQFVSWPAFLQHGMCKEQCISNDNLL